MNTTDTIESLFEKGTVQINIGKNPKGEGWVMEIRQLVEREDNDQTHLVHQIAGPSIVACLLKAQSQVDHAQTVTIPFRRK